jgi:prevent-host-death family protein
MSNNSTDNTISLTDFRNNLSEILNRVAYRGERIKIRKNKKIQAVLVDKADMDYFEALEMADDVKVLKKALKEDDSIRYSSV